MIEDAQEIFDHLPVRQNEIEARYIRHLWLAFENLSNSQEKDVRAFAVAPFHLLFMLSLQYKGMRLYIRRHELYARHKVIMDLEVRRRKAQAPTSVFDLALISESPLADIFSTVGVSAEILTAIKERVRERNDGFAHAKGAIEEDLESKIELYLTILRSMPDVFKGINEEVALEWLNDLSPDDDRDSFVETRIAAEYLCPTDFSVGTLHDEFASVLGFESFNR